MNRLVKNKCKGAKCKFSNLTVECDSNNKIEEIYCDIKLNVLTEYRKFLLSLIFNQRCIFELVRLSYYLSNSVMKYFQKFRKQNETLLHYIRFHEGVIRTEAWRS